MTSSSQRWWLKAQTYLPIRSHWKVARRLGARANAERDAGQFQVATALYEQALQLAPGAPHFAIQFGHCRKEAGDYDGALALYLRALEQLPDDPDLALQLGHLAKLAGRHDDAEREYRRAATLRPGWLEAELQLSELGRSSTARDIVTFDSQEILAFELLPQASPVDTTEREGFHVLRLGAGFAWTRGGYRRVLRGIEAVRGYVIAAGPIDELTILVDGEVISRTSLTSLVRNSTDQLKYVFNVWHNFALLARGPHEIVLRAGRFRHIAQLDVVEPHDIRLAGTSDAVIGELPAGVPLEQAINALPSVVRSSRRNILPLPVRAILVQRVDQLGDLACSVPALQRLRSMFPEARIVGLLTTANEALGQTLGLFNDIVVAEFPADPVLGRRTMSHEAQRTLRETLHRFNFDLAIDLGETSVSRPLLRLSGARFLYGFKGREFPWLDGGLELTTRDPANRGEIAAHEARILALIESLGAIGSCHHDAVRDPAPVGPAPARFGLNLGDRYLMLHAGARLEYSRWPGFGALIRSLLNETKLKIVVMGGEELIGLPESTRLVNLPGEIAFTDFDALVSGAAIFIGNDSGPKHLAALHGVPTISLHMARMNWNEWGQTGDGFIISRRVPCAGCGISGDGTECGKDFACIRHISLSELISVVRGVLKSDAA